MDRVLRVVCALFGLVVSVLVVVVVASRVGYPHDLEWMTGGVLDHVERMRSGQPVYAKPSAEWMPFLYPPGYYAVAALFAKALPVRLACRAVSIVATIVTAVCIHRTSRQLGASRFHAAIATMLFIACFNATSFWYDIERADPLFVAVAMVATCVLVSSETVAAVAFAGALFGLSCFVKQPGLTLAFGAIAGLLVARRARHAWIFAGAFAAVFALTFAAIESASSGWFSYYCYRLPATHGVDGKFFTLFFIVDLSHLFVPACATVVVLATVVRSRFAEAGTPSPSWAVFGGVLGGAFLASGVSRMHVGGWPNVLMFWTAPASVAAAIVATRLESTASTPSSTKFARALGAAVFLVQFGLLSVDPGESIPQAGHRAYAEAYEARVRDLEKEGEVLSWSRGHITAKTQFHHAALMDVLRGGGAVPEDLKAAFHDRRYRAVMIASISELHAPWLGRPDISLFDLVFRSYYVAERFSRRDPGGVVGYHARPRYALFPRAHPLDEIDHDALVKVVYREIGAAEASLRITEPADPGAGDDEYE